MDHKESDTTELLSLPLHSTELEEVTDDQIHQNLLMFCLSTYLNGFIGPGECMCGCVLSRVQLFVTSSTVAC